MRHICGSGKCCTEPGENEDTCSCSDQVIWTRRLILSLPLCVHIRSAVDSPIQNTSARGRRSRRCNRPREAWLRSGLHKCAARYAPSSNSGRSVQPRRYPSSCLCGMCCKRSHASSTKPSTICTHVVYLGGSRRPVRLLGSALGTPCVENHRRRLLAFPEPSLGSLL